MPPDSITSTSKRLASWPLITIAIVFVLHAIQASRLFPTWRSLLEDRPVLMVDHAIHLYHGALGSQFLREHKSTWGYDPFFMAGYPETPVWDSSSNPSIAFELLGGGGYHPFAYKAGLFLFTLSIVPMIAFGARASGLSLTETAATAVIGLVIFWACVPAVFWRTGLFGFVTASAALLPVLGLLLRFDRRASPGRGGGLLAAGACFLFVHITAPVLLAGGAAGYGLGTLVRWRSRRKRFAAVLLAAVLAIGLNLFWLVPLWRFRSIRDAGLYFLTPPSPSVFTDFLLKSQLDGRVTVFLLGLGTLGMGAWWVEGQRLRTLVFGGTAVMLLGLCWLGGLSNFTRTLEPFRFLAPLQFLLSVPVGSVLTRLSRRLAQLAGTGIAGTGAVIASGISALILMWILSPATISFAGQQIIKSRPLVIGLRPEDRILVEWLRSNTDLSARILFEDQLRLFEQTDPESTHWTPLLPLLLQPEGRAFVGGVYFTAFIAHNRRANFGDYTLGGRRIDLWTDGELRDFYAEYNIGWVVAWSPLSRYVLDQSPMARRVGTVPRAASPGREVMRDEAQWKAIASRSGAEIADRYLLEGVASYALYQLERQRSYFLEGKGRLTALALNRVELADVAPEPGGNSAVLSLHWLDTFKSDPPLRISPAFAPGDPVPFVRIELDRPLDRIVIFNAY